MLRPYGVWAVISPFNFPAALAGGPIGGALVAGNTVVLKPSQETPLTAAALYAVFRDAGLPAVAPCTSSTARASPPAARWPSIRRWTGCSSRDPRPSALAAAPAFRRREFPGRASRRWAARTPPS